MGAISRSIKNVIRSIVRWSQKNEYDSESPMPTSIYNKGSLNASGGVSIGSSANGLNFVVYPATGGKVVQLQTYDPRTDRSNSSLYIVTDKEDLGEELAQIITKECLTR